MYLCVACSHCLSHKLILHYSVYVHINILMHGGNALFSVKVIVFVSNRDDGELMRDSRCMETQIFQDGRPNCFVAIHFR